ncbi:succinoglycan biosynthesis protein exop [Deinococcus irradiatisoli]|uniref:Succinoglycan biosynthesis protein exop n=1 Tax=Deinococcus irradiatisoli TaxID=2202254 RepID=A0A2Z3JJB0_9DEIO|nr:tyrosine-protein kinase domain-containing protein [Deinococcus irradiatisoli]AWN23009.1 succinoglycan biosynthesis protein exop [Deinococcus irradiatisoli]
MSDFYRESVPPERVDNEVELSLLWRGIRRRLPIILAVTVVLSTVTYFWSRSQASIYESSSSVITVRPAEGVVGATLVPASVLPSGALDEALKGSIVLNRVVATLRSSALEPDIKAQLISEVQRDLQSSTLSIVDLTSQLDPSGYGVYTVTGRAPTAVSARVLTNLTVQALLAWDENRALLSVQQALKVQRAQLAEIERQISQPNLPSLERETLVATRALTQRNLAQTSILAQATTGSLALVSPAVEPLAPVAPLPTRNAVLAGLLTLLLGTGVAALLTVTDRTVRSEEDLLGFGLPILGSIPRLRKRDIVLVGIVRAARQAGLYEAVGFLRVNLLANIDQQSSKRIMLSSTAPGEGKSSMTATLADGFASSGERVLIIDADLRRGTQQAVWDKYERQHEWQQLVGQGGGRTLQEALRDPENVQVIEVEPNVYLLPAGPGLHDSLALLNRSDLGAIFERWGQGYSMVLIDSPPLLSLADGLVLGRHVDGVLLITEAGQTTVQAVKQVMRRTREARVPMLGFLLNKVSQSEREGYYGQNYGYSSRAPEGN